MHIASLYRRISTVFHSQLLHVFVCSLFVFFALFSAPAVFANEGRIDVTRGSVSCEGVSIWEGDRYRLVGRCQGLVYPYAERLDTYLLWVRPESSATPMRLREVERGIFDAQTNERFTGIMITAEEENNPRQPGSAVIVSGDIQPYDFRVTTNEGTSQPHPTPGVTVTPTPKSATIKGFTFGTNAVVNIILVIVLVVVVLWILFFMRR